MIELILASALFLTPAWQDPSEDPPPPPESTEKTAEDLKKEEKAAEENAKRRIEEFKAKLKGRREADALVDALEGLGNEPHPLILSELSRYLVNSVAMVRVAAAKEIGKFRKDVKAAQKLVAAARAEKSSIEAAPMIRAAGATRAREIAPAIADFFQHKENAVVRAAFDASVSLKSKDLIDPLLALLQTLEKDKNEDAAKAPQQQPAGTPAPTPPRYKDLLDPCIDTLKKLTGEKFMTYKEYSKWWKKYREHFKEPPDEEDEKPGD